MSMLASPTDTAVHNYMQVSQFLALEASLLDQNLMWEWFELLADDYNFEIPIRVSQQRDAGSEYTAGAYHMKDTKGSTRKRIERLFSGHAWAEDPASRTCRVVGSVLVTGERGPGELTVSSSILVYRERGLSRNHDLIAGHRSDVVRLTDDGPRLVERVVHLAHTILSTSNLGIFL